MPIVTPGDLHVNRPLSNVMTNYRTTADLEFIADKVFPNIPSDFQTDFYYRMGSKAFLQTAARKRAPATETPGVEWNFTKDTFSCDVWGLHHDIEDQLRANADANFTLERTGTELITQQMLLRREKEWVNAFFKTGVWISDQTGVAAGPVANQFLQFDQAGSSPITVLRTQSMVFFKRTGLRPNFVVFGPEVWDALIDHPEIVDRIKYTQAGFLTEELVARALRIRNVYVANAVEAVDQTEELTPVPYPPVNFVSGKQFLLGYAAPTASRNSPSAGYTFSWNGYLGANAWGGRVKKFRMEAIASDRIEIEAAYDMKLVAPELGTFFTSAVA